MVLEEPAKNPLPCCDATMSEVSEELVPNSNIHGEHSIGHGIAPCASAWCEWWAGRCVYFRPSDECAST